MQSMALIQSLASMNIVDCVDSMREREISFHMPVFLHVIALTCFPYWRIFRSDIEFSGDYGDLKEKGYTSSIVFFTQTQVYVRQLSCFRVAETIREAYSEGIGLVLSNDLGSSRVPLRYRDFKDVMPHLFQYSGTNIEEAYFFGKWGIKINKTLLDPLWHFTLFWILKWHHKHEGNLERDSLIYLIPWCSSTFYTADSSPTLRFLRVFVCEVDDKRKEDDGR